MVADAGPAVGQMPLMDCLGRHVGVRVADMVHDNCISPAPVRQGAEGEMRRTDGDTRQDIAAVLPGRLCDLFHGQFWRQCQTDPHDHHIPKKIPALHLTACPL